MSMLLPPNATNVLVPLTPSNADGLGITDLEHNTAGLLIEWMHAGGSGWSTVTLVAMTAGTWASGGFVEVTPSFYQLGLPAAAINAAGGTVLRFTFGANPSQYHMVQFTGADVAVSSRNAVAPDNVGITEIKAKTDTLPTSPAATGDAMTLTPGERTTLVDAMWSATTRTLSSFGSLVDNIWLHTSRTLTAFNFLVTTDNGSREASKADLTGIATTSQVNALLPSINEAKDAAEAAKVAAESADAKLDDLDTGDVVNNWIITETAASPASSPSKISVTRGVAYDVDHANAFHWASSPWPSLAGATVTFTATSRQTGDVDLNAVPCQVLASSVVRLSLTSAQTLALDLGTVAYRWSLNATLADTTVVVLGQGYIEVVEH